MAVKLNKLPKTKKQGKKRAGRGYGSGRGGHTAGRGAKGQKARSKVKIWFEGGQLALIRRLPKTRGKGRFKPLKDSPVIINLSDISHLAKGSEITQEKLIKEGIINKKEAEEYSVKMLGGGEVKKAFIVKVKTSKSAKAKIEKAGGKVE